MKQLVSAMSLLQNKLAKRSILLATFFGCAVLNGCGGGAGSASTDEPKASKIAGVVLDGYLRNALIFWDCNGNISLDAGEKSVRSIARGIYEIDLAPSAACELIAEIDETTIDEDRPFQTQLPYVMMAAPGRPEVVSPLTTAVGARMRENRSLTFQQADKIVGQLLDIDVSVVVDYRRSNIPSNRIMGAHAAVLANDLKKQYVTNRTTSINLSFASLSALTSSAATGPQLKVGVPVATRSFMPWRDQKIASLSASNPSTAARTGDLGRFNSRVDALAGRLNALGLARGNFIDWGALPREELESAQRLLGEIINSGFANWGETKLAREIRTQRTEYLREASVRLDKFVDSEAGLVGTFDFFSDQPFLLADLTIASVTRISSTSLSILGIGKTFRQSFPAHGPVGRPSDLEARLKVFRKLVGSTKSFVECSDALGRLQDSHVNYLLPVGDALDECASALNKFLGNFGGGASASGTKGLRAHELLQSLMLAQDPVIFEGKSALERTAMQYTYASDMLAALIDIIDYFAPLRSSAVITRISGSLQILRDLFDQYASGALLANEMNQHSDVKLRSALAAYNSEVERLWGAYYQSFLINLGHVMIKTGDPIATFVVAADAIPGAEFVVPAGAKYCVFRASGEWAAGPNHPVGFRNADGVVGYTSVGLISRGVPIPSGTPGALVAKASGKTQWSLIGSLREVEVTGGERIEFMMNDATDDGYTNGNFGSLTVVAECSEESALDSQSISRIAVSASTEGGFIFRNPYPSSTICSVTASGRWGEFLGSTNTPYLQYDANGIREDSYSSLYASTPVPSANSYSLIVQQASVWRYGGSSFDMNLAPNEEVGFMINDSPGFFWNNTGALELAIVCAR